MKHGHIKTKIKCLKCDKNLDGFTSLTEDAQDDEQRPRDGDMSICAYCETVGRYAENLTKLEPVSQEELNNLDDSYKHMLAESVKAIRYMKMQRIVKTMKEIKMRPDMPFDSRP